MKTREMILIVKDCIVTQFMQAMDVYESFKFHGRIVIASQQESHWHLTPDQILEVYANKNGNKRYCVVGVIIPNVGAAFDANHRVLSDGKKWICVENLL
jgi:hypothetical protein